jgi:tetratricopeptide (TPR) repeat protein
MSSASAGDAAVALLTRIAGICEEGLRDEARAIEHYRRILEIAPGSKEALDALGRIYESTEKWPEFVDVTRRLIRITTDRNLKALLYFKCGSVMESKFGKEEDAIRYYDAAIKTSPSCLPAVHGLRDLYLRRKDWAKVLQSLELEVKLWQDDKERAGVFAQIGHIYGDFLHDPDRALSYYENALAVDPDCLPANRALFEAFFARGDWGARRPARPGAGAEGDARGRSQRALRVLPQARRGRLARARSAGRRRELHHRPRDQAGEPGGARRARPPGARRAEAYDFPATYRELDKIYRKRDDLAPHLARVLVAAAAMLERAGDLDAAERGYREALALVPHDFAVLAALVDLNVNMRRMTQAADVIVRFLEATPAPPREMRVPALLRLAEIYGDGEMDPHRAAGVLREVLRLEPGSHEGHYLLAQELYLLGRFPEARQHIEKVIEIAAAPGPVAISPEALARYYYYLGRILEAMGEARSAGSQYRRAAEYDPAYGPTALALAKRAVAGGDRRSAENTLISAAHAAIKKGGQRAAVPLQRGLARILLAAGERAATIEAYRGILAVEPESGDDRVALAEIYAMEDVPKAIVECHRVLDRDLRHPPCYRLLAQLYERQGEPERALRVNGIFELMGYAEEQDRQLLAQARARHLIMPRRSALTDELRATFLLPPAGKDRGGQLLGELHNLIAAEVGGLFMMPGAGTNLTPAPLIDDPGFKVAIADNVRLFGFRGRGLRRRRGARRHGGAHAPAPGGGALSRAVRPAGSRAPLPLGRAFDSIRGGYATLMRMSARERGEVGMLLRALFLPEAERPAAAQELVRQLPRKTQKALERFVIPGLTVAALPGAAPAPATGDPQFGQTASQQGAQGMNKGNPADGKTVIPPGSELMPNPDQWMHALSQAQDRAGILACDDFGAAARALAILHGEELAVTHAADAASARRRWARFRGRRAGAIFPLRRLPSIARCAERNAESSGDETGDLIAVVMWTV